MNAPNFSSMAVVYAVPGTGVGGPCSGRPHDLAVPGGHAEAGWLHRHVGSDRRCQPGCGAAAAQYGRREEGDQRGLDTGELEGPVGQAAAQGSRRALDGQIQQGQTARGWLDAASRSGNTAFWLSETMSRSIAVSASFV